MDKYQRRQQQKRHLRFLMQEYHLLPYQQSMVEIIFYYVSFNRACRTARKLAYLNAQGIS